MTGKELYESMKDEEIDLTWEQLRPEDHDYWNYLAS